MNNSEGSDRDGEEITVDIPQNSEQETDVSTTDNQTQIELQNVQQTEINLAGHLQKQRQQQQEHVHNQHQTQQESQQNSNQIQEQPVMPEPNIINVEEQTQMGNLIPQIMAIQSGNMSKDVIDCSGYNILHHAVSYNKVSGIIPLIEKLEIDVDILSRTRQTPLMIACNYGFIKVAKILLDQGASLNEIDDNLFSALLYAVKNNKEKLVLYLISCGADINIKDINGCGLAHWSAYNNNVFLLDFFHRLGLPLNEKDRVGYTPFMRAIFNEGYDSVNYLLKKVHAVIPNDLVIKNIKSQAIRTTLSNFISENKVNCKNRIIRKVQENSKAFTQFFLIGSVIMFYYCFITQAIYRLPEEGFVHYLNIVFNAMVFLFVPYVFYFSLKLQNASSHMISLHRKQHNQQLSNELDYSYINEILKVDTDQGISVKPTILHRIYETVQLQEWLKLEQYSTNQLCSQCLHFKEERMAHCDTCGICVPNHEVHLKWFDKCLNRSTHKYYFLLLMMSQIMLELFFTLFYIAFSSKIEGYRVLSFFEIPYIMIFVEKSQWYFAVIYLLAGFYLIQNLIDLTVALYGICYNMTYYEIFNRTQCWYYFQQTQGEQIISRNIHVDFKQRPTRYFKNKFYKGVCKNIVEYLSS